ncbi:hypothetical protein QG37_04956 [Candidozyma auris]|nr:hypothetical protein QG37_04956 [[Candida] auris]
MLLWGINFLCSKIQENASVTHLVVCLREPEVEEKIKKKKEYSNNIKQD